VSFKGRIPQKVGNKFALRCKAWILVLHFQGLFLFGSSKATHFSGMSLNRELTADQLQDVIVPIAKRRGALNMNSENR